MKTIRDMAWKIGISLLSVALVYIAIWSFVMYVRDEGLRQLLTPVMTGCWIHIFILGLAVLIGMFVTQDEDV